MKPILKKMHIDAHAVYMDCLNCFQTSIAWTECELSESVFGITGLMLPAFLCGLDTGMDHIEKVSQKKALMSIMNACIGMVSVLKLCPDHGHDIRKPGESVRHKAAAF